MTRRELPFVSVLTPTRNRRIFIPQLLRNYRMQTYPLNRMELVIADDGTDSVEDLFRGIPGVKYLRVEPMTLGAKRNLLTSESSGEILVHMDDDDYYPRNRVEHAVTRLLQSNRSLAGSSEMYIYNLEQELIYVTGPFSDTHGTNGTFAYTRDYLRDNRFADDAIIQDELAFTHGYTNPMVQLDPGSTILCIWHQANTWNKQKTSMDLTSYGLKDVVKDKDSLRFYRYQLKKLLLQ